MMLRQILVLGKQYIPKENLPPFEKEFEAITMSGAGFDRYWLLFGVNKKTWMTGQQKPIQSMTLKTPKNIKAD